MDLESRIRIRAYELWETEGRPDNRAVAHWVQAESELMIRKAPKAARKTSAPKLEASMTPAKRRTKAASAQHLQ